MLAISWRLFFLSPLLLSFVAFSIASTWSVPARAGGRDAIIGGIIGFGAGYVVGKESNKKKYHNSSRGNRAQKYNRSHSRVSRQSSAEVSSIQNALNTLGFNAGEADGQIGNNTRSAIKAFQMQYGYPTTGTLTPDEKAILMDMAYRQQATMPPAGNMPAGAYPDNYPVQGYPTTPAYNTGGYPQPEQKQVVPHNYIQQPGAPAYNSTVYPSNLGQGGSGYTMQQPNYPGYPGTSGLPAQQPMFPDQNGQQLNLGNGQAAGVTTYGRPQTTQTYPYGAYPPSVSTQPAIVPRLQNAGPTSAYKYEAAPGIAGSGATAGQLPQSDSVSDMFDNSQNNNASQAGHVEHPQTAPTTSGHSLPATIEVKIRDQSEPSLKTTSAGAGKN